MNHKNSIIWKRAALLVGVLALTAAGELMAQAPTPRLLLLRVQVPGCKPLMYCKPRSPDP